MIISSSEFIISHESQGPMKMQGKEVAAGKTGSNGFWGGTEKILSN